MIRLNLLPESHKRIFQREVFLRTLLVLFLFCIIWTVFFFIFVGQSWFFIAIQNDTLGERVVVEENADSTKDLLIFEDTIKEAKNVITTILKAGALPSYNPNIIFDALTTTIPRGVSLTSVDINSDTHILIIGGHAGTRDNVLLFEEGLRSRTDIFDDVVSPISNILKPSDIDFSFAITLK